MRNLPLVVLGALVLGCGDGRPTAEQAHMMIQEMHPDIRIVRVRGSMDEVVANAYEFTYVTPCGQTNRAEIQFMDDGTGRWRPRPENLEPVPDVADAAPESGIGVSARTR